MPRVVNVEQSIEIGRPAGDVFAFLTEVERFPEWQSSVSEIRVDGPIAEGARIHDVREFMGRRAASTLEVARLDAPRLFTLRVVEGPLRYEIDHSLRELDGRTTLTVSARAKVPGLFGFAARPLVKAAERELRADLERLRDLIERQ
jgi:uncharacterized membrane protein